MIDQAVYPDASADDVVELSRCMGDEIIAHRNREHISLVFCLTFTGQPKVVVHKKQAFLRGAGVNEFSTCIHQKCTCSCLMRSQHVSYTASSNIPLVAATVVGLGAVAVRTVGHVDKYERGLLITGRTVRIRARGRAEIQNVQTGVGEDWVVRLR